MKNFFKILGVALIAGSMLFVACKKDEENNGNNGNNGGNNNTPTDTTPTGPVNPPATTVMSLVMDGQTYEVAAFGAGTYTYSNGTTQLIGMIQYGTSYSMEIDFGGMTAGTYDYDNNAMAIWYSGDENADYFEYTDDESGETTDMPVWMSVGAFGQNWETVWGYGTYTQDGPSQVISAIDMNAQTMSCVYYDGLVNVQEATSAGTVSCKEFTLTLTNATWDEVNWTSSKSLKAKKSLKKLSL